MNNYYTNLTEALLRKYDTSLNEAWAKDMPNWMKGAMAKGGITNPKASKVFEKARKKAQSEGRGSWDSYVDALKAWEDAKGTSSENFPEYQSPRNDYTSSEEKSLFGAFQKQGIDINSPNIKFIEGDLPTKNSDPRLQPPNIPIWHIPSINGEKYDQVYARGINDLEKPYAPQNRNAVGNYSNTPFKNWSVKKLAEVSDKFCYIDGSTIETRDFNKLKNDREAERSRIDQMKAKGLERTNSNMWYELDKSGYVKIPSAEKYAKQLELIHLKAWAKNLLDLENMLNDQWADYQASIGIKSGIDVDYYFSRDVERFIYSFRHAVDCYTSALEVLDDLKSKYSVNSQEFLNALQGSNFTHYIQASKRNIKDAADKFKDHSMTVLDF